MDKSAAVELADRLERQLGGQVQGVRAEHVNPYSGDASIGWAVRVVRQDSSVVDVIGSRNAGYQLTTGTLGWVDFPRIVAAVLGSEPPEEVEQLPLMERLTALAAGVVEMGRELAAIRDELVMRGVK